MWATTNQAAYYKDDWLPNHLIAYSWVALLGSKQMRIS
jgi:hypothetical protein